jgi:hypothetical protein
MTKEELIEAAQEITGGSLEDLSVEQIGRLMTITQHVTDLCLNELESRGELAAYGENVLVPYVSDYWVETILTREDDVTQ